MLKVIITIIDDGVEIIGNAVRYKRKYRVIKARYKRKGGISGILPPPAGVHRVKDLTRSEKPDILKKPCSRGDSGALYLQSAIAGVMTRRGLLNLELPAVSDVDIWVLCNGNL